MGLITRGQIEDHVKVWKYVWVVYSVNVRTLKSLNLTVSRGSKLVFVDK